jgi:predicted amidohydrolase YtcJ
MGPRRTEGNLLLTDCKIYTGVEEPKSARGLAVEGGLIVKVGSELEARQAAPRDATVLSLPGGWAYPGLNDAHIHLTQLGGYGLDLSNLETIGDLLSRIRDISGHAGRQWIIGRGWDQEKLREGRPPTKGELDRVSPDRPVLLYRVCGHVGVANSRALEHLDLSGLDPRLVDDKTGLLREEALKRLTQRIPAPPRDELVAMVEANCRRAAESGLTMVQVILSTNWREELDAFKELAGTSNLKVRAALWFPAEDASVAKRVWGDSNDLIRFGGAKIFLDGSLGARTAALFEDYTDQPGWSGVQNFSDDELMHVLEGLLADGIRPAMHAIGDRAVDQALRVIESLSPALKRPRIEHASLTSPAQIRRMRELNVCPVIQPHFAVSDRWALSRLGPRIQHLYRFKDMVDAGLKPAGSSDAPVEPLQPLTGMWAAVTNPTSAPLTPGEALELYTGGSAWAAIEEERLGRLKEGMLGDIVVLAENILSVGPSRMREVEILTTVVNGEIAARPQWLSF